MVPVNIKYKKNKIQLIKYISSSLTTTNAFFSQRIPRGSDYKSPSRPPKAFPVEAPKALPGAPLVGLMAPAGPRPGAILLPIAAA